MLLMLTTMVMLTIILHLMLIMWPRLTPENIITAPKCKIIQEDKENQTFHVIKKVVNGQGDAA